ncbi:MAG: ABC transporter permease, partial [Candidatus Krumholzibacteriota bacterium]|nr:ABC transporter permease [Candidatus Krumholzibacteriota bacterium]
GGMMRQLVEKIIQGKLDIVVAIPSTVLDDGKLSYITREVRSFTVLERFESVVADIVLERRLASAGLEYEQVRSLTTGVFMELSQITSKGEVEQRDFLSEWGLVFVFVMILYMALLTWGITISRGIIEEKSSRVVEVLLSSIKPFDLLFGKVVGTGLAGLTQLSIWAVAGFFISLYGATGAAPLLENIHVAPIIFVYFMLYFVLGFLLYSAMFTVIGSICSTDQDAQQLQGLVTLPLIIPILSLMLIIQSPNSTFAVVLSLIPVFTPMVMLARVILLEPPLWQILLSIALLTASIFAAVSFSARVFRIGILMYGKRPSLREVIRWYRLSG